MRIWVFLALFSVYALTAGGHNYSSDGETMFNVARSLWLRADVELPPVRHLAAPAVTINADGRPMPVSMPGQSIVLLPLTALGELTAGFFPSDRSVFWAHLVASFTNAFVAAGVATVFFVALADLGYDLRVRLITTGLLGLGTLLWPYAKLDFAEPLLSLLLLAAGLFTWRYLRAPDRVLPVVAAGLLLGAATLTKISGVFLGLPMLVYILGTTVSHGYKSGRYDRALIHLGSISLSVLLGVGLVFYYNWLRFGGVTQFGYGEPVSFTNPFFHGAYSLVFSTGKGVVFFAPAILLFVPGLNRFWGRHRHEAITCLAVVAVGIVFFSTWRAWHGDVAWGPRYIVYLMPFLMLPVAELIRSYGSLTSIAKTAIVGVATWALITQLIAVSVFYNTYLNEAMKPDVSNDEMALSGFRFDPRFAPVAGEAELIGPFFWRWLTLLHTGGGADVPARGQPEFDWFYQRVPDFWWVFLSLSGVNRWLLALAAVPVGLFVLSAWRLALAWRSTARFSL